MLTVRANPQEDSGTSPSTQVVFTMDSGRVLVNGAVYKGMSITKVGCNVSMQHAKCCLCLRVLGGLWPHGWCLLE